MEEFLEGIDIQPRTNENAFTLNQLQSGVHFKKNIQDLDGELVNDSSDDDDFDTDKFLNLSRKLPHDVGFDEQSARMINVGTSNCLKKMVVKSGRGAEIGPNAIVRVHYDFYLEYSPFPFDSTFERKKAAILNMQETFPGISEAIATMREFEEARFIIGWPLMFGEMGHHEAPSIPPRSDILADIHVIEVLHKLDIKDDSNDFERVLSFSKQSFIKANEKLRARLHKQAISLYKRAADQLEYARVKDENDDKTRNKWMSKIAINIAIGHLSLHQPEKACVWCMKALQYDAFNPNIYYHFARAKIQLSDYQRALKLITTGQKLQPDDDGFKKLLSSLEEKRKRESEDAHSFAKKALGIKDAPKKAPKLKFEVTLNDAIDQHFNTYIKPYKIKGPFTADEKKICESVAKEKNLLLQISQESGTFSLKEGFLP